ncbi:MAG: cation transporter [Woeseia sp.]
MLRGLRDGIWRELQRVYQIMNDRCCQTTLDTAALHRSQRRVLVVVLVINVATFAMMIAASFLSGSSSLLSGALDNFGDAATYAVSFAVVGAASVAKARVALFKGVLILGAAIAVGVQIAWRLLNPEVPLVETMGLAAVVNFGANLVCLRLLTPFRHGDVNMSSAWECSRNDVMEGLAVILAAVAVWSFGSGWPDIVIATALLLLFLRSAFRVLGAAWRQMQAARVR